MNAKRIIGPAVILLVLASTLPAQVESTTEDGDRSVRIYKFQISPAALPAPVFKYRLTVPPHQQIAGNAITHILRSYGENSLNAPLTQTYEKFGNEWDKLKSDDAREASSYFDSYIDNHIRRAARCREIDWGLNEEGLTGMETAMFLLPSIQQTREISRVLSLRTRHFIAEENFPEAIEQIRMNYRLAECVGKMKFLVASLVGVAEVGITNQSVVNFVAAEGSPNLYWALRELPDPIVTPRDAVRLEMSMTERMIPAFKDPLSASHTPEEWAKIYRESVGKALEFSNYSYQNPPAQVSSPVLKSLLTVGASAVAYPGAKQRLIQAMGLDKKQVEAMSVGQVLMVDAAHDYQTFANQVEASFYLGNKFTLLGGDHYQEIREAAAELRLGAIFADLALPAVEQVNKAYLRVRRETAALITIESIRHHVSIHNAVPESLDDLTLPAPKNPMTGKPFLYEKVSDKNLVLTLPKTDGATMAYRYEISLRTE